MGPFYTQVLVREADAGRCVDVMRSLLRQSFVIPSHNGITVVCDKESEGQDMDILDSVALTLSAKLNTSAVALLNHDDDWLVFRFFDAGRFIGGIQVGHTFHSLRGRVWLLRRLLNPKVSLFALYAAFLSAYLFQAQRHARIARVLGLPPRSIGVGYTYVSTNNFPGPFDKSGLTET